MIQWNATFIRGLAQSVLDRARTIRSGLAANSAEPPATPVKKKPRVRKSAPRKPRG